jgi:5,10-methylenetetrahydromethanopterin reductase
MALWMNQADAASVRWAQEAEMAGLEWIGVPDSPLLIREAYVTCTSVLLQTEHVAVGPMVTNPLNRDPSVVAGSLMTLDEIAPGRVRLGIGAGDSASVGVGLGAASVAQLRSYVQVMRELLKGRAAEWQGRRLEPHWQHARTERDVKIYVSCHGVRTMRMAGAVADGVIAGFGMRPENITLLRTEVSRGATNAGRDPDEVDIWWHPFATLAPSIDSDPFVGFSAHFLARGGMGHKQVPPTFTSKIERLARATDRMEMHGRVNRRLIDELLASPDLKSYLSEREGGLVGSAQEIAERIKRFARDGAENLIIAPLGVEPRSVGLRFIKEVMPLLRTEQPVSACAP